MGGCNDFDQERVPGAQFLMGIRRVGFPEVPFCPVYRNR
ncbi:MAG: hypothetical protein JWP91_1653 [Fibrobacteres bacterium]|nr:hypothetical protein [Fibrobacterota bacterium]